MLPFEMLDSGTRLITAMFDGMADPILLCDFAFLVLAANRVAVDLLGTPLGGLLGRHASDVLPGFTPVTLEPGRLGTRSEWRCRVRALREGGHLLEVITRPLADDHGVRGWTLALTGSGQIQSPPEFVGQSAVAQELLEFTSRIAASRARSVLLVGESGTGKDLIAKRLHSLSTRAAAPFVHINCATLPGPLLENELFGHERGAFTGADDSREGLLETAHGGTVFLDEIGELPLPLQAKLLRVLEDHTFRRVGGSADRKVDLRVVGATNQDLEKAIEERRFRADLYYRLNVVQIRLPALRERREDISLLAAHFLLRFCGTHHRSIQAIHPGAQRLLDLYSWPGNVRELRNVIERAVLVENSPILTAESLPIANLAAANSPLRGRKVESEQFSLRRSEQDLVLAALAEADGNQTRAAALLGIGRFSLRYKMKKLGILHGDEPKTRAADSVD